MNASSHTLEVRFDAKGLVAHAGLILPATLAQRLGLPELLRQHVRLGKVAGAANPDRKAMTVIGSLLAGGEWMEDVNALRAGGLCAEILGVSPAAASTVGTFLRAFTAGHARQLDAVQEDLQRRAWAAGAGPRESVLKLDLDATVVETYGLKKQGGKEFTTCTRAATTLCWRCWRRAARWFTAGCGRAGRRLAVERAASPARRWPACGGGRWARWWYARTPASTPRRWWRPARPTTLVSISVRLQESHHELIAAIPEEDWQPISYWLEGAADVAEIPYQPFGKKRTYRLIVRRVAPTPGSQLWLQGLAYSHHAFITDREGDTLELEADHCQHAVVENVIRDLKHGLAFNHMPSGKFGANAAWLALNVMAYNLDRWMGRLGSFATTCLKTWRLRFLALPGRLIDHARRRELRLSVDWPWREQFRTLLVKLRAVAVPSTG